MATIRVTWRIGTVLRDPRFGAIAALLIVAGCTGAANSGAMPSGGREPTPQGSEAPAIASQSSPPRQTDSGEGSPEVLDLSAWKPAEFWRQVAPGGEALYLYDDLPTMTNGVDAVVVGHVTAVGPGRPTSGDDTDFALGEVSFQVDEVIRSALPITEGETLTVQFTMTDKRLLPRYTARVPTERVVLFLANLGLHAERFGFDPDDPTLGYGYFTLQSPLGHIRDANGSADVAKGREDEWLLDLDGRPFEVVVELVREAVRDGP